MNHFTCPVCGGHSFGRVCKRNADGIIEPTDIVECHGKILPEMEPWSVHKRVPCKWRGVWTGEESTPAAK